MPLATVAVVFGLAAGDANAVVDDYNDDAYYVDGDVDADDGD